MSCEDRNHAGVVSPAQEMYSVGTKIVSFFRANPARGAPIWPAAIAALAC